MASTHIPLEALAIVEHDHKDLCTEDEQSSTHLPLNMNRYPIRTILGSSSWLRGKELLG